MNVSRRGFLVGCSSAIAAMAGGSVGQLLFAPTSAEAAGSDILVVLFLRGGCDALSLVAPTNDSDYNALRPQLRLRDSGDDRALLLKNPADGAAGFGLHSKAAPLKEIYDSNNLAIVHACGLTNGTRSHFDAMDYIERGTPESKNTATGWLTRHLTVMRPDGIIPAAASSAEIPTSLLTSTYAAAIGGSVNDFRLGGHWKYGKQINGVLETLYNGGDSSVHRAGQGTLQALSLVDSRLPKDNDGNPLPYTPAGNADYPDGSLGESLQTIAQLIKLDVGLQVATVDFGGWDTHDAQTYVFPRRVEELARALAAFYNDTATYRSRLTVVVMSEFGRRLRENNNGGTDHGHGGVMLLLGGNVNGGRMHGVWPGLASEQLDRGVDLRVATDYRQVLSEVLVRRTGNADLGVVFPGLASYDPLGVVQGNDIPVTLG